MAGITHRELMTLRISPVEAARVNYLRPSINQLVDYLRKDNYQSFIIVREPFHRFLSAFKDKIEGNVKGFK